MAGQPIRMVRPPQAMGALRLNRQALLLLFASECARQRLSMFFNLASSRRSASYCRVEEVFSALAAGVEPAFGLADWLAWLLGLELDSGGRPARAWLQEPGQVSDARLEQRVWPQELEQVSDAPLEQRVWPQELEPVSDAPLEQRAWLQELGPVSDARVEQRAWLQELGPVSDARVEQLAWLQALDSAERLEQRAWLLALASAQQRGRAQVLALGDSVEQRVPLRAGPEPLWPESLQQ